ncbi:MAG: arginine repressor [Bdellovibrionia bacterium]
MGANTDSRSRLDALRGLLSEGMMSSQEELREKLERMDFAVTQSTVSRDLRKLGAVKAIDPDGRTVYRLGDEAPAPLATTSLADLIIDIQHNLSMIVLHTTPGSASLIARHLDHFKPAGILGTIAGDDTIFIAPAAERDVRETIEEIQRSFEAAF